MWQCVTAYPVLQFFANDKIKRFFVFFFKHRMSITIVSLDVVWISGFSFRKFLICDFCNFLYKGAQFHIFVDMYANIRRRGVWNYLEMAVVWLGMICCLQTVCSRWLISSQSVPRRPSSSIANPHGLMHDNRMVVPIGPLPLASPLATFWCWILIDVQLFLDWSDPPLFSSTLYSCSVKFLCTTTFLNFSSFLLALSWCFFCRRHHLRYEMFAMC